MQLPGSQYVENPFADSLLRQGSNTAPVSSLTEGLARMASALMGGYLKGQGRKQEDEAVKAMIEGFRGKTTEYDPASPGAAPVSVREPGGFDPAIAALSGMEGNQYAGRLAQQLMLQKVMSDQQAEQQAAQMKQTLAGQMALKQAPGWTAPEKPPASVQEYEFAKKNGYTGSFQDFKTLSASGGQETFGNSPIWGTDAQGKPVLLQPSNRGGVKQVQLPPGVTPERGQVSRVDLGDKIGILDATGRFIGYEPKGIEPQRTVQDGRVITMPAVPGGPAVGPAPSSQQPGGAGNAQPAPMAPQPGTAPMQPAIPGGVGITDLPPSPKDAEKDAMRKAQQAKYANVVAEDIDRTISMIGDASVPVTGIMGAATKNIPGTPGYQVGRLLDTIKANAGFDRLQEMRAASPTGGALGQVSDFENKLLQATIGNLEQAQDKDQLLYNLRRVKDIYLDIIHGPGNRPEAAPSASNIPAPPPGFNVVN